MVTWSVVNLERQTSDGFVTTAHWLCTGVDGEYSGSAYGSVGFQGDVTIPYEDITEADVIAWVKESLGTEQVDSIEDGIATQIESAKAPVVASGMPWQSQTVAVNLE
jgi:hypothetical protein